MEFLFDEKVMIYLRPLGIVVFSILIGFIFEKFIHVRLLKWAKKSSHKYDDIIVEAFDNLTFYIFLIGGLFIASHFIPIRENILLIIHKVILIGLILLLIIVGSKIAVGFIDNYTANLSNILPKTSIFQNITRVIIFSIGGLILLQTLGISITPIITALGVGGLAVALAFQDTLSNLFAGLHIIISRQIKVGDYIKLESGEEGFVVDIAWRYTEIRQMPNNLVIIPNSKLASAIVTNYNMPETELSVPITLGVSYDSDLEKVERVTIEVAKEILKEIPGGVENFDPVVRYHTFADFSINLNVVLRAKQYQDQFLIKHEFIKRLHKRYQQEGIVIPYPIRTVYMNK